MKLKNDEYNERRDKPAAFYKTPQDVVNDSRLNKLQKLAILRQWEHDARELQVAEDEGMHDSGQSGNRLHEIIIAIESLDIDQKEKGHESPIKQGGTH